jgi:signal transduction histidine kinase
MRSTWDRSPTAYKLAALLGVVVVLVCYANASTSLGRIGVLGDISRLFPGPLYPLAAGAFRLVVAVVAIALAVVGPLALVRPWAAIGVALVPMLPALPGLSPVPAGVVVSLAAVAVVAGWHDLRAALWALGLAEAVVLLWIATGGVMTTPFDQVVLSYSPGWSYRVVLAGLWTLALLVVLGATLLLRRLVADHLERRGLLARSAQVEEQSAVTAERARLARDLHDVVAHHVSLIAVRAETAPYTHPTLGSDARGLLAEIAQDARLALDELRGVLGILGRSAEGEPRAPQPGLADVPALVDRSRSTGAGVTLDGDVQGPVAPAVGYVAYRVVQEALTNARRHAPGAEVHVSVGGNGSLLVVQVGNALVGADTGTPSGSPGRGLAGMRERVEAVGGHLEATGDGSSFVVRATLPRSGGSAQPRSGGSAQPRGGAA